MGWGRRWSRSGTLRVAGVLATSPELGRVWVTGLRLWPRVFSFPFEAMEGRIGRAFGILLTSKVRLRSAGSGESLQLEQLRKGVPEAEGDTFCKLSSPSEHPFKKPTAALERPRRMNHPRFLPPPGPARPVPRI